MWGRGRGRQSRRLLTIIPGALVLLWQLSPFLSHPPQATLPLCAEDSNSASPAPGHLPFWHWELASPQDGVAYRRKIEQRWRKRGKGNICHLHFCPLLSRKESDRFVIWFVRELTSKKGMCLVCTLAYIVSYVTFSQNWSDSWHWFILFIMFRINLTLHPCHSQNSFISS